MLLIDCNAMRSLSQGLDGTSKDFLLFAPSLARAIVRQPTKEATVKRHLLSIVSTAPRMGRSCALDGVALHPMFASERHDEDQTQPGEGISA